jgi:hypothetical protein
MQRIAEVVGKTADAEQFAGRAVQIRNAINAKLWHPINKRYVDGLDAGGKASAHSSLHANAFPLAMGVVPAERVPDVLRFIKSRRLNCNALLAMFLFEALYDHEEGDYAYSLLKASGLDSPLNMLRKGATTTWETWDLSQKPNASLFHPATAFSGYILASRLFGIQSLEPGFSKILIRPSFGQLTEGSIKVPTIRGPVSMNFKRAGKDCTVTVGIPDNTTARVELPSGTRARFVKDNVGSGRHTFSTTTR